MKLFKIDFGIRDRYRRGLSDGVRSNRSPQSETAAAAATAYHHDPHHHATSPSSPSALFSASMTSSIHEPAQQWSQLEPSSRQSAYTLTRTIRHTGYDDDDDQDRDASSSDGYLSSSSSSSGQSLSSSSSLSPSQSDEDEDEDEDIGSDDSSEDDDDDDNQDSQENDAPKSRGHRNHHRYHHHHHHHDYYGGGRDLGQHGGLLPIAPAPAIPPSSDRDALEQEARLRRLERDSAKRRQSLTNQAAPAPRRKKRKKAKDLRKQDPLVMDLIRDEAEREQRVYEDDDDYDGDNSSNDNDNDDGDDGDDEDEDEDEDSVEDSESDESDESESNSSSGSSENESEMGDSNELEDMSRVSMSEYQPGIQDEGELQRLPPQGSIFGDEDMANQDDGQYDGQYDQGSSLGNGGSIFDLVSSTHDPMLHNHPVLQKMEVDNGPGHPHPEHNNNTHHLHNHTTTPTSNTWASPVNFDQGVQFTFTHISNHQPQSNRDELYVTRSDTGNLQWERDPFVGSSSSSTAFTPLSLSSTSPPPSSNSNTLAPRSVYTSNRAFFTLSRSASRCWKRPKRS
ncbi:hypothetical protein BGZ59_007602 [Podila verticillata]|nr:hypothetical protein BGZ59_007602 [Podila verticillata]